MKNQQIITLINNQVSLKHFFLESPDDPFPCCLSILEEQIEHYFLKKNKEKIFIKNQKILPIAWELAHEIQKITDQRTKRTRLAFLMNSLIK